MDHTTTSPAANAERGLSTDRRIAAVELLLSQGWSWSGNAWMPPNAHMGAMAHAGWLEAAPDVKVGHVIGEVPVTLLHSTAIHMGHARPRTAKPDNRVFPLFTPLVLQEGECPVCSPNGLFGADGSGPWDCYNCRKPGSAHTPAPAKRYGIEIPDGWMLAPLEATASMVTAMINARQDSAHPSYRGEHPMESAGWDAALGATPKPEWLPDITMIALVPLQLPKDSLVAMADALKDREPADLAFPYAGYRDAWREAIRHLPSIQFFPVSELLRKSR